MANKHIDTADGYGSIHLLCIDGKKFIYASNKLGARGAGVSTIQVYEGKKGKNSPSTCK